MSRRRRIIKFADNRPWIYFFEDLNSKDPRTAMLYEDWLVLHEYAGLSWDTPRTLKDIGEEMGVSPQRAHQRKTRAIARLRLPENGRFLQAAIEREYRFDYLPPAEWRPQELKSHWHDCPRHGRTMRQWTRALALNLPVGPIFCPTCSCLVTGRTGGRPAKFCDAACRQAAYRARGPHPRDVLSDADFALADEMVSAGHDPHIVNVYFLVMRGRTPFVVIENGQPCHYSFDEDSGVVSRRSTYHYPASPWRPASEDAHWPPPWQSLAACTRESSLNTVSDGRR